MSKQSIYVRHKDEIFKKYKEHIDFMWENRNNVDMVLRDGLMKGYKEALECFNKSYNIWKNKFGDDHQDTKHALEGIQDCKNQLGM